MNDAEKVAEIEAIKHKEIIKKENEFVKKTNSYSKYEKEHYLLDEERYVIEEQDETLYRLPSFIINMSNKKLYDEVKELLLEIKNINNQYIGDDVTTIKYLLRGNEKVLELREKLFKWADEFCNIRLKSFHSKDDGSLIKKYLRLTDEISNIFHSLVYYENSANSFLLSPFDEYMNYLYFKGTTSIFTDYIFSEDGIKIGVLKDSDYVTEYDKRNIRFYNKLVFRQLLFAESQLKYDLKTFNENIDIPNWIKNLSTEEKYNKLEELASDIVEMQSLIIRNYNPIKSIIDFSNNLKMQWEWNSHFGIGLLSFANNKEKLISRSTFGDIRLECLSVLHTGQIVVPYRLWLTLDTIEEGEDGLNINLYILEKFHEKLLEFYSKIDFDRILKKYQEPEVEEIYTEEENEENELEVIAVSIQKVEEPVQKNSVKKLRVQKFLNILETFFDCEVKQGKGSEITVYKKNAKKHIIGHHKKNEYIHSIHICKILKRLEIPVREWIEVYK